MTERQVAIKAACKAGQYLRRKFLTLSSRDVHQKSPFDSITCADIQAGKIITRILRRAFPTYDVINEEAPRIGHGAEATWFIDPIDGTTNFITHNPCFTVAIGLVKNEIPTLGVIYWPEFNEMFVGELGQGAFLNNKPIRVATQSRLSKSILAFNYTHQRSSITRGLDLLRRIRFQVHNIRHIGSTALDLAFVASKRYEGVVQTGPLNKWDVVAGIPIVLEAGGKITDFAGQPFTLKSKNLVATNSRIHQPLLKAINS